MERCVKMMLTGACISVLAKKSKYSEINGLQIMTNKGIMCDLMANLLFLRREGTQLVKTIIHLK